MMTDALNWILLIVLLDLGLENNLKQKLRDTLQFQADF